MANYFKTEELGETDKMGGQLCLLLSICILAFIEMPPFYGIERGLSFSMVLTRLGHIGLALLLCGAFFPLLKLLPQNEQLFVYGGEQSLFIYLYHPYVLLLLSYISSFMFHEITVLMGVILALLTTAILLCLSRVKIFQKNNIIAYLYMSLKYGIITHYDVLNHGAMLQLNALVQILRSCNVEAQALQFEKNYDFMARKQKSKYKVGISSVWIYMKFL